MKRQIVGLLCGAVAALVAPAAAQAAHHSGHSGRASAADTDVRCLVLSMNMIGQPDQGAKTVGFLGAAYFIGRLDAGPSHGDLEPRMEAQIRQMNTMNIALQGRMRLIGVLGQQLQQRFGVPPAQHPAPGASPPPVLKPTPSPQTH